MRRRRAPEATAEVKNATGAAKLVSKLPATETKKLTKADVAKMTALEKAIHIARKRRAGDIKLGSRVTAAFVALYRDNIRAGGDSEAMYDVISTIVPVVVHDSLKIVAALAASVPLQETAAPEEMKHLQSLPILAIWELSDLSALFRVKGREEDYGKICAAIRELIAAGENFAPAKLDGDIVPRFDEDPAFDGVRALDDCGVGDGGDPFADGERARADGGADR